MNVGLENTTTMNTERLIFYYGFFSFFICSLYFLLLEAIGLADITELRFVNLLVSIAISHRLVQNQKNGFHSLDQVNQWFTLLSTNLFTYSLCTISMLIYTVVFQPVFMDAFDHDLLWGGNLTVHQLFVAIFVEGMILSVISSSAIMIALKIRRRMKFEQTRSSERLGKEKIRVATKSFFELFLKN